MHLCPDHLPSPLEDSRSPPIGIVVRTHDPPAGRKVEVGGTRALSSLLQETTAYSEGSTTILEPMQNSCSTCLL